MSGLTVGSLFSGVGGLDLGLERAGMNVIWQSEIDPFASRVLARHWPTVPNLGDITTIDWSSVERPDLICGGYPCQPFSLAGPRNGTGDPRHLWPWMLDAVRVLRPRYTLLENVAAHLGLGFDAVLGGLAEIGFDAEWSVVSACSVGAPHLRRRLFCVAYPSSEGPGPLASSAPRDEGTDEGRAQDDDQLALGHAAAQGRRDHWRAEPGVAMLADGFPRGVVRPRNRAYGNAVVPQVAELIGRRITAHASLAPAS